MARSFDGTADYVRFATGSLNAIAGGAMTLAVILKRSANLTLDAIIELSMPSNFPQLTLAIKDDNNMRLMRIATPSEIAIPITIADNWVVLAVCKAAGTSTPRGHKYVYDTNTWSHVNGATTVGDASDIAGGWVQFGRQAIGPAMDFAGDMAVAAAWKRQLTDAQIERLPYSLMAWWALAPDALWTLDQSSTARAINDLTGNGADQTTLSGTTVSTDSVAGFSYGHEIIVARTVPAPSTTGTATLTADTGLTVAGRVDVLGAPTLTADTGLTADPYLETTGAADLVADAAFDTVADVILRVLDWHWYGSLVYETVEERDRAYERILDMIQATVGSETHPDDYYGIGVTKYDEWTVNESTGPGLTWSYRLADGLLYEAEVLAGDLRDYALGGQSGTSQLED